MLCKTIPVPEVNHCPVFIAPAMRKIQKYKNIGASSHFFLQVIFQGASRQSCHEKEKMQ